MMTNSRPARFGNDHESVFEMRLTRWRNPRNHSQKIVLFDSTNRKIVVTFQPGEEKDIPSEYDFAIHRVDCGQEECHRGPVHYCLRGHPGVVVGGLAPLLERVNVADTLEPTLDPDVDAKRKAEAAMAAAALQKKVAEDALVVAAAKVAEPPVLEPKPPVPANPKK